jgi:hypothetical protein
MGACPVRGDFHGPADGIHLGWIIHACLVSQKAWTVRRLTALHSAAYRRASARIGPSRILRSTTYQVSLRVLCRYHIQIYLITELHPNWPTQQLGQSYECWTSYQVLTQESPGRAASPMFPMALCPVACIYAISITSRILPSI